MTLNEYLTNFVSEERNILFEKILENRTRYITVVLEDIYQPQNASAVIRSCECFGIQDIHIIEQKNTYQINPDVVIGSSKWLSITNYNDTKNNTLNAINKLRGDGYRLIATTPNGGGNNLDDFDILKGKFALFFGTEQTGLTDTLLENADENLKIPMYGFTKSFNISVSAAIILHSLSERLRTSDITWQLSIREKKEIKLEWLKKTLPKSELIIERYYQKM